MKKTLFLLLCTVQFYGQTSTGQEQSFPYGIVNESLQTITTPTYIGTFGTDGTQGKIPSAYIAKTSDVADSLATKENVANKSDSYTTSSSIAYVSGKALVEGLGTKQNTLTNPVTGTFVAGRVPYTSSTTSLVDSSRLLWGNTNSYLEVNGNSPRFTLKNNLNNYSTYFTNNAGGALFLKNQQDKTLAIFNNPVTSTDQPKLAIGQVTSIPTESQLYVYGGENGANINARGSATVDEANIDLEGNDWVTNPNSIGLSYFGSNATSFGTVMGYSKNKLGQIRFQDNTVSAITSNKVSGVSPIRFGINDVQIANVSNTGISYQSDFSSINSSNPRWLADKSYVDAGLAAKQNTLTNPITGTLTSGYIPKATGVNSLGNGLIYDNGTNVGIGTTSPAEKLEVTGTIKAANYTGSATLTGTPTAPTATVGTNTTQIATTAFVTGGLATKENTFSKNTAFNKNFGSTAGTVAEGNDSRILNGQTAFGWGNHASAGYALTTGSNIKQSSFRTALGLGSNAYTSTAYLPLSGGDINGLLKITREGYQLSLTGSEQGAVDLYKSGALGHRLFSDAINFGIYDLAANVTLLSISNSTGAATFYSTVTATSFNGSATLTGTPTAPTAAPGTNTTQIATTAFVLANARPYKVYTALLSQSGTNAPTATVLENTLGGTIVWTRSNIGQYVGTLTGAFTDQKTIIFVNRSNPAATAFDTNMAANVININTVGYTTFSNSAYVDGQTNSASIEIRVYN